MKYITTVEGKEYQVEVLDDKHVSVDGTLYDIDFESISGQPVFSVLVNGRSFESYVYPGEEEWQVLLRGRLYQVKVEDEREKRLRAAAGGAVVQGGELHLKAPMPGLIVAVHVNEGDTVTKGQVLLVLESMKMQNELKAPRDGKVNRVRVKSGESVEQKQTLLSVR
jgi:biotin carboxyl carrier protein